MSIRKPLSAVAVVFSLFILSLATGCSSILDDNASDNAEEDRQQHREECIDVSQETFEELNCGEDTDAGGEADAGSGDGSEPDAGGGDGDEPGGGDGDEPGAGDGDEPGGGDGDEPGAGGGDEGDGGEEDDGDSSRKAISFIAFCVEDGSLSESDITNREVTETKDGGEPLAVSWESSTPIDRVVLKAGTGMENFDAGGATSGTARVGSGTDALSSQSAPSPCPDGETGVKFELE